MKTKCYDEQGYPGEWKTTEKGEHYFIREGETPEEAWRRHVVELKSKTILQLQQKSIHEIKSQEQSNEEKPEVDENLIKFAKDAIEGKIKPTNYYIVGEISARQRAAIEQLTGEKIDAQVNTITAQRIVQHINRNHGPKGSSNHTMRDLSNYGYMNYVLNNYDTVELAMKKGVPDLSQEYKARNGENAKQVIFTKKIGVTYVVAEAITDSKKYNEIRVTAMYTK